MRRFNFRIRDLLLATTTLAVFIAFVVYLRSPLPRKYHDLDYFVHTGWELDVEPDLPGPFRATGTETQSSCWAVLGEGQSMMISVKSAGVTRKFRIAGEKSYKFKALGLETLDDQPTCIVLKKRLR